MSDVQVWRYRFPYCQKGDGGTFFLDSTGVFLAYSAYGAFGYVTRKESPMNMMKLCLLSSVSVALVMASSALGAVARS